MCHALSEPKYYCLEFGTRILFHKMQKICHDVYTIETTGTLICYYCKLYLHEYIHTHTQTYTHAAWANHMHTTCIRMSCITREKIMRHHNNPAHNSKTFLHLVSVPHSRKPWSALYWGHEEKFHGSTASTSRLSCNAYPSNLLPYIPLLSSNHSVAYMLAVITLISDKTFGLVDIGQREWMGIEQEGETGKPQMFSSPSSMGLLSVTSLYFPHVQTETTQDSSVSTEP